MKGVDKIAPLSHKTAAYTNDITSYVPAINIVNRHDVFLRVLYYIVNFIIPPII